MQLDKYICNFLNLKMPKKRKNTQEPEEDSHDEDTSEISQSTSSSSSRRSSRNSDSSSSNDKSDKGSNNHDYDNDDNDNSDDTGKKEYLGTYPDRDIFPKWKGVIANSSPTLDKKWYFKLDSNQYYVAPPPSVREGQEEVLPSSTNPLYNNQFVGASSSSGFAENKRECFSVSQIIYT